MEKMEGGGREGRRAGGRMALSLSLIIQPSVPLPWQNGPLADTRASNNGLLCVCLWGGGGRGGRREDRGEGG